MRTVSKKFYRRPVVRLANLREMRQVAYRWMLAFILLDFKVWVRRSGYEFESVT